MTPPATRAGYAYLEGTLTAPPDSQAAYDTIDRVRSAVHAVPGANALVGGVTAINLDVQRASAHDRNVIIPLILVVVFVILGLLLRALVAPLILTATVVLSFAAALGVSAFFFNHVFGFGGADTSLPAVRVRVPGRAGHRLQHLPDDPGAGGGDPARRPARRDRRPGRDRRGDHLGGLRAGRHVRRPGHDPGHVPDRNWVSRSRSASCSTPSSSGPCSSPR